MHVWQTHLGVAESSSTFYHRLIRQELVNLFSSPRKRVIEIGSSGGYTGKFCKEKFPGCEYWGFELNQAAARESLPNIDKVVCGKFEDQQLDLLGLEPGSVDGVVLGDVLEHMYSPWHVLTALLPWLSDDAELAISIPNVRNLWLLNEIAEGRFTYEENGLLDVTHIRFFTLAEIYKMMEHTGYQIVQGGIALDERLADFHQQNQAARGPCVFHYKSISLKSLGENISELCARQFIFLARPLKGANRISTAAPNALSLMHDHDSAYEPDPAHHLVSLPPAPTTPKIPVHLFAFYLPQFHPTPENSKWWGEGFTEWANVTRARPAFTGHYQPRHPGELGYYDLRVPEIMRRQVELAKQAGLAGFIFYYYWFSGQRMLEMPLQQYMDRYQAFDLPFFVMWCNENWRRTWVDKKQHEDDLLMEHKHLPDDPEKFIDDLKDILLHPGYFRVDGKPVLLVYPFADSDGAYEAAQIAGIVARWRAHARKIGIGDIIIGGHEKSHLTLNGQRISKANTGLDFFFEFPPNNSLLYSNAANATGRHGFYDANVDINIVEYADLPDIMSGTPMPESCVRTVLAGSWDNTARKGSRANIFHGCTPALYGQWLQSLADAARARPALPGAPMVFINAWNEWAEGVYLEPDRKYGYALLAATQRVAYGLPPTEAPDALSQQPPAPHGSALG